MDLIVANFTNSAVQKIGWSLIHFIWQATTVALLLAILLKILRNSSASLRYIISCTALGLMILLPVVTMQYVTVPAPPLIVNIESATAPVVLPVEPTNEITMSLTGTIEYEDITPVESEGIVSIVPWKQRAVDWLEPVLPYMVCGWLIGVFGLSVWHLGGWAQLQRLRKKMVRRVDTSLQNKMKLLSERLEVNRTVQLLESALVQVPTVIGWLRPVILLPASAITGLSSEQLEAILAHELAHIKRFDYLINMLQTVVEILGFYHPAVWWISRRIRAERENCCDDLAVSISGDRICYASALTSMEEIRAGHGELAVAVTGGNLFKRVYRLLGKDSGEKIAFSWIPSATVILLLAALLIPAGLALSTNNQAEISAEFLLGKMLEHQSKVENLQYVTEYDIWTSTKFTDFIEEQVKKMRRERLRKIGIPEEQIQQMTSSIITRQKSEYSYEVLKCTIDNLERIKTERTTGTYDSSGNKSPDRKYISSWDGTLGIDFHQQKESPGSVTITDSQAIDALQQGHPWKTCAIRNRELADAIKNKKRINVEELKNGLLRMVLDYETSKVVAVFDPSRDYACTLWENYNNDKLTSRSTVKSEKVAKGIWFPVSGRAEYYSSNDGSLNIRKTFKTSRIIINDPSFDENYFSIDLPDGVHVTDLIHHKQYIVGSRNEYDLVRQDEGTLNEEQETSEPVEPNSWQERFYGIYSLQDDEVLKRIVPPFMPERRNYYLNQPRPPSSDDDYDMVSQYIFYWDDGLSLRTMSMGGLIRRLNHILRAVIGLSDFEYEIPDELLNIDMSGDWILRKDAPKEVLLKSLEKIIKEETERDIEFVKRQVQADVITASGQYSFKPLAGIEDGKYILLSTNKTDTYVGGGGGGSGTIEEFLRLVGSRINMKIINETEPQNIKIRWRNHDSSDFGGMDHDDPRYGEQLDLLLNNLSIQTGLIFEKKNIPVEKWFVVEAGVLRTGRQINMPADAKIENIDSSRKVLIETQILHVNDEFLEQVGLDAESLKNSNPWTQNRVDDSDNPLMFVIDSQRKQMLLKTVDENGGSSSISRIFMMAASGREAMIKNHSGYDFKSKELGRFIKIKPQISQDGRGTYLDCELLIRQVKYFGLFYDVYIDKKFDQNEISESEIFEYQVNSENALLSDDNALLILGGKVVSVRDVENRKPILRYIPVAANELFNTTSKIGEQANEIILIKTTIVPPEGNDDVNAKAASFNVAKIIGLDEANELVRIHLDLDDLKAGQYVEIKDDGKNEAAFKQVDTSEIGKRSVEDFPAYASYIEFEVRSNFDLNLSTKRFTRSPFFQHDKWDAYFVSPDAIVGDGYFSPATLCVCMWSVEIWKHSSRDMADAEASLVAVKIKPKKPQEKSDTPAETDTVQQKMISGRCLDFDGKPLANAEVMIFCQDYNQYTLNTLTELSKDKTDSEGRFTLGPVAPIHEEEIDYKNYLVYVPPNGHGPACKEIDYFNQNTDSLELKAYKPVTISGTVVTEDSQPIAGAQVWVEYIKLPESTVGYPFFLRTVAALPGWSATTDNNGVFHIDGVPDGVKIVLHVTKREFATSGITIKSGMVEEKKQVKMVPAAVIKGRVLNAKTGQPAAGVRVHAEGVVIILGPRRMIMPWAEAVTDEKGRYELESLHAYKYNIWAEEKDMTVVALDSFEVEAGQTREAPDLLLVEGGFIVGRVINEQTGKPIKPGWCSSVFIHDSPSRPESGMAIESSEINEDGSFRIRVAPGRNHVYLSPRHEWGMTKVKVIPKSQWVDVEDGETVEVEFRIRKLSEQEKKVEAIWNSRGNLPQKYAEDKVVYDLESLDIALKMFAYKNEGKMPDKFDELEPYLDFIGWDKRFFQWLKGDIKYLGTNGDRKIGEQNNTPIAYCGILKNEQDIAYVLFMDGHDEPMTFKKLKELGIKNK